MEIVLVLVIAGVTYRLYQMLNPANGIKEKQSKESFYTTLILLVISDFIMVLDLFLNV